MTYSVVPYTPDRVDDVLDLQSHHWGGDRELNRRYFRWKYEANPFGAEPEVQLAYDGAAAVGMQGCYAARWVIDGEPVVAHGKGDMVVHPDHRRLGVSQLLVDGMLRDQAGRGRAGVIATSTTQVAVAGMERTGWIPLPEIATFRREPSVLPARLAFAASSVHHLARRLAARLGREPRAGEDTDVFTTSGDLNGVLTPHVDVDGLVRLHERSVATEWHHVVDRRWFEWRFSNPLSTYRFAYERSGELEAYVVVATGRGLSSDTARVVDWGAIDDAGLHRLLDRLVRSARDVTLELGLGDTPDPFLRAGFFLASRAPIHARPVRLLWYPLAGDRSHIPRPTSTRAWRDVYSDNY